MSDDHRAVQRVRFATETTYGTDLTSDVASNFDDLRFMPTVIQRQPEFAQDDTAVQRFHQQRNDVRGPDRGACDLECHWTGTNEAIDEDTTATKAEQSKFLEHVFGGYVAPGQGSLSASGEAATGCVVSGGEGSQFSENTIVAMQAGGSGAVLPRLLATIDTDTLVWWPALPSAIANGATVHNAQNIYYDETTESWIQLLSEASLDRGNIWLLRGGAAHDFRVNLRRDGLITWTCTVRGAVYDHDDEITTPQGGGSLSAASFSDTGPIWGNEGGCHFGPTASSTLNLVRCVEISVDPGIGWIDVPDHAGIEGMGEWHRDRSRKTVELTILKGASAGTYELWHDAMIAETDYGFLWWAGAAAGSIRSIAARTCQIIGVDPADYNGLEAQKVSLLVKENDQSSDGATPTTALRASPLVFGMA